MLGICVPVLNNFKGLTTLVATVDQPFQPYIIDNWNNNRGVARAWNLGIAMAIGEGATHLLISNDDVSLLPGTLGKLCNSLTSRIFVTASNGTVAEGYNEEPDFSCFMIRPYEFREKYGEFDENFFPAYFEDNDMAYRIRLAGDKYEKDLSAVMIHEGSVTQNAVDGGIVTGQKFEANRDYYRRKWGGLPLQEKFTTPFDSSLTFKEWELKWI